MSAGTTFAVAFIGLYVGHVVGDHWVQTDHQARTKGQRGMVGRLADLRHVLSLTVTQLVFLLVLVPALGLHLSTGRVVAGLAVNAVTHWWADRRVTLAWLADLIPGKGDFYRLGQPRPLCDDNPCLGTGAYALDQSWHLAWLFVAAVIMAGGAR